MTIGCDDNAELRRCFLAATRRTAVAAFRLAEGTAEAPSRALRRADGRRRGGMFACDAGAVRGGIDVCDADAVDEEWFA